mmetsp:Transcript_72265/g.203919  ORF Transcript_72265/g.203919 Transcript_72265/m.203919 type:complete len:114 (+) Transcript_72265:37-378(+)
MRGASRASRNRAAKRAWTSSRSTVEKRSPRCCASSVARPMRSARREQAEVTLGRCRGIQHEGRHDTKPTKEVETENETFIDPLRAIRELRAMIDEAGCRRRESSLIDGAGAEE